MQPIGTEVGTLSPMDAIPDQPVSFTLVAGAGDIDNVKFAIDGSREYSSILRRT